MHKQVLKCQHRPDDKLGYIAWHEDAECRMARGKKQIRCQVCNRWIWPYLWRKRSVKITVAKELCKP